MKIHVSICNPSDLDENWQIYITVEEGGPTSGHSYKGEINRFLGIPSAGNRLSSKFNVVPMCFDFFVI